MSVSSSLLLPLLKRMEMPADAVKVFPATIERLAFHANMPVVDFVHACMDSEELRDYLAKICIKVESAH